MKKLNKLLSVGLSLAMCAGMVMPALAVSYNIADGSVYVENDDNGVYSYQDSDNKSYDEEIIITGSSTENTVIVGEGVKDTTITLDSVDIDVSGSNKAAVSIGANSDVTVELDGENTLTSGANHAGLELNNKDSKGEEVKKADGGSVTIQDDNGTEGTLTATGGNFGAGIGSGSKGTAGDITIDGADVTATGGNFGAGIGSGSSGTAGDITIDGADVTATGGSSGAGIGSGSKGTAGDIAIDGDGANVTATGGSTSAGIGSGSYGTAGDIAIDGADVTATGGDNGAGIGSGWNATTGAITIDDANVTAQGGRFGAGIGTGGGGAVASITIEGGDIIAKSGAGASAIGSGASTHYSPITIKDLDSLIALGCDSGTTASIFAIDTRADTKDTKNVNVDQSILNVRFGRSDLLGAKQVTVHIIDSDGKDVVEPIELRSEEGSVSWDAFATIVPEGKYYVYVTSDKDPEGALTGKYGLGTSSYILYAISEDKMTSASSRFPTYSVNYAFDSATADMDLPEDMPKLPEKLTGQKLTKDQFENGTVSCGQTYEDIVLEDGTGTWSFDGWEPQTVFTKGGGVKSPVTVTGKWSFNCNHISYAEQVTTQPTCTEKGVKTFTCDTCGYTYTEDIDATGHTLGEAVLENLVPAEPGVDGSYDSVDYCTVCGVELSRETVAIAALPVPATPDEADAGDDVEIDDEAVPLAAGPVTRAEFIDYLWRHEGAPASDGVCTFTDVAEDHEFILALAWAEQNGVAVADEDGAFQPDELVTVADVREFLGNFARTFSVTMRSLTTLTGADDEAVLNCDEVLAEFFGEELPVSREEEAA